MKSSASRCGLALVAGAASVFAFAPFALFPLPLLTFAVLAGLWQTSTPRGAAACGFAFGLGLFLAGVSWVYVSMQVFGGMPAPLAGLAALLFCAYLALYPALAGWLFARLRRDQPLRDAALAAAAWTLTEWLRGVLLSGFPWLSIGHSQTPPSPLAGFAPILGSYGLSALVVFLAVLWGLTLRRRAAWRCALVASLLLIGLGAGLLPVRWTMPSGAPLRVSLLQGNIEQSLKWQPERLPHSLDTYLDLARRHPADLIVLPETALPLMLDQLPVDYLIALQGATRNGAGSVLFGIASADGRGHYFNSAVGLSSNDLQVYQKRHLVPFGEFTPPAFAWTLALLRIPMSDFSAGAPHQPLLALAGQRVAVNICYEDIFGAEIIRALPQASLLVNLSNTAWFGDSLAQPQHLQISRLRALETGRFMLRATNTGMTAVIDPRGRVRQTLPPFTRGALVAEVQGYAGSTPYARWGDGVALGLVLLAGLASQLRRRSSQA